MEKEKWLGRSEPEKLSAQKFNEESSKSDIFACAQCQRGTRSKRKPLNLTISSLNDLENLVFVSRILQKQMLDFRKNFRMQDGGHKQLIIEFNRKCEQSTDLNTFLRNCTFYKVTNSFSFSQNFPSFSMEKVPGLRNLSIPGKLKWLVIL